MHKFYTLIVFLLCLSCISNVNAQTSMKGLYYPLPQRQLIISGGDDWEKNIKFDYEFLDDDTLLLEMELDPSLQKEVLDCGVDTKTKDNCYDLIAQKEGFDPIKFKDDLDSNRVNNYPITGISRDVAIDQNTTDLFSKRVIRVDFPRGYEDGQQLKLGWHSINITTVTTSDLVMSQTTGRVTLPNPVNVSSSFVSFTMFGVNSVPSGNVACILENSTSVYCFRNSTSGTTLHIQVAEFNSGVTVQHMNINIGLNSSILYAYNSAINTSNTFIIPLGRTTNASLWGEPRTSNYLFNSTHGELNFSGPQTNRGDNITFDIVSMNGAVVQSATRLAYGTNDVIVNYSINPVNLSKSFITTTLQRTSTANIQRTYVGAVFINTSMISVIRNQSGVVLDDLFTYTVVDLPEGSSVQFQNVTMNTTDTKKNFTINTINQSRTIAFTGNGMLSGLSLGTTSATGSGFSHVIVNITNTTFVTVERIAVTSASLYPTWILQFPVIAPGSNPSANVTINNRLYLTGNKRLYITNAKLFLKN